MGGDGGQGEESRKDLGLGAESLPIVPLVSCATATVLPHLWALFLLAGV